MVIKEYKVAFGIPLRSMRVGNHENILTRSVRAGGSVNEHGIEHDVFAYFCISDIPNFASSIAYP